MENQGPPLWYLVTSSIVFLTLLWAICWGVLRLWRGYHRTTDTALEQLVARFDLAPAQTPGYVLLNYTTYVGAFFTVQETPVQLWVRQNQAQRLLNALAGFNLKRGLITGFAPWVLLLTASNYVGQFFKIRAQSRQAI